MTPPRKVFGTVHDVSTNRFQAVWLSSFGRDKADVRPAHKTWLDRHVVWTVEAECSREDEHVGLPDVWQVWVIGARRVKKLKRPRRRSYMRKRLSRAGGSPVQLLE
jgi:hypothetical protein